MKNQKTIKIETRTGHFEEFPVIPIKCNIGDTIWWNSGTESLPNYYEGEVTEILNEEWWIYDNGDKVYGRIVVKCTTKDSHFYEQFFKIDADEIIYKKPVPPEELFEYKGLDKKSLDAIDILESLELEKLSTEAVENIQSFASNLSMYADRELFHRGKL